MVVWMGRDSVIFNIVDENVNRMGFMEVMEPPKEGRSGMIV